MPKVRLIDANALHTKILEENSRNYAATENVAQILLRIETAPTIEPEIRRGRWIFVGEETLHDGWTYRKHRCTECDFVTLEAKNFCQNCGAKMDGCVEK